MKEIIVLLWVFAWGSTPAQEMKKAMEDRAREMHRVIGLDDREAWKKFVLRAQPITMATCSP